MEENGKVLTKGDVEGMESVKTFRNLWEKLEGSDPELRNPDTFIVWGVQTGHMEELAGLLDSFLEFYEVDE